MNYSEIMKAIDGLPNYQLKVALSVKLALGNDIRLLKEETLEAICKEVKYIDGMSDKDITQEIADCVCDLIYDLAFCYRHDDDKFTFESLGTEEFRNEVFSRAYDRSLEN